MTQIGSAGSRARIAVSSAPASPRLHCTSSSQSSTGRRVAARKIASTATRSGRPASGAAEREGRRKISTSREKARCEPATRSSQKSRRAHLRRGGAAGVEQVLEEAAQPFVAGAGLGPRGLHAGAEAELGGALHRVARDAALARARGALEEHHAGAVGDHHGADRVPDQAPLIEATEDGELAQAEEAVRARDRRLLVGREGRLGAAHLVEPARGQVGDRSRHLAQIGRGDLF